MSARSSGVLDIWSGAARATRFEGAELCKWLGALCMLTAHVAEFVFGVAGGWPHAVGRLAFPLFLSALVMTVPVSLERVREESWVLAGRLAAWGVIAQAACVWTRGVLPLNVLFTFACGVGLVWCAHASGWRRWAWAAGFLAVGWFVEFGWCGVLLVFASLHVARAGAFVIEYGALSRRVGGALGTVRLLFGAAIVGWLVAALCWWNGDAYALLAVVVVALVRWQGVGLPRVKRLFYVVYVAQWLYFLGYIHA